MSFDNSRYTFDPWKNFSSVVMQQGRVQLDADWNEWLAELARRIQADTLDLYGHAAYPPTTPSAFLITATTGTPNTVTIGLGRMYVDGLLAENHGARKTASWDTALAELSGTPQPPGPAHPNLNPLDFTNQPYLPHAVLPTDNGAYLFYLDVWTREVTYLEDPKLVDIAVAVDTTGRLQTVWQVKFMANAGRWTCATPDAQILYPAQSTGRLTTDVVSNPTAGPCCLTDGTGFTGQENQLYRVEIHQGGVGNDKPDSKTATFKWSRENASVETSVSAITSVLNSVNQKASQLAVASLGRDQVLGFNNGDWIELLDDWSELWGNPGVLAQVDSVNVSPPTITLTALVDTSVSQPAIGTPPTFPVDANFNTDPKRHTRIRRWDQSGIVLDIHGNTWCDLSKTGGAIPVPAPDTMLVLESGITAVFGDAGAIFNVADFWSFAARTADGSVEKLKDAPPLGIHHHYTKLSTVTFSSPTASNPDCRTPAQESGEGKCCCCSYTVGDGVNSFGQYTSIQQAINALPTTGGEVCVLPGRYYEYVSLVGAKDVVIRGCGVHTRLASPTMNPAGAANATKASADNTPESGLAAIVTVMQSSNVELQSFVVEAADNEVGILLDASQTGLNGTYHKNFDALPSNVTITDISLTASTLPAIVAAKVNLLLCTNNRIAMKDASSQWPAVYLAGSEVHFEKNWVGLGDSGNATAWMPNSIASDLKANFISPGGASTLANGGIQIGGGSRDVFVVDNEIEGGLHNGISLGSFALSINGSILGQPMQGLLASPPDPAATQFTLQLPSTVQTKSRSASLISAGTLQNVEIARNRIRNMGLCGIGPVGFFNLEQTTEVITIKNLTITQNVIAGTLQDQVKPMQGGSLIALGYGAICVPDVQNLIVQENAITDFGSQPGARVCGIFVLNGEQVEIGRNQILETRDWTASTQQSASKGPQAGIAIMLVTPPPLNPAAWQSSFAEGGSTSKPLYQPGLPAMRIENNVVRMALGLALEAFGFGPFSITGNQFSSGGTVQVAKLDNGIASGQLGSRFYSDALTVYVLNYGAAIEIDAPGNSFKSLYNDGSPSSSLKIADRDLAASSSGAVLFTDNRCQLETRASGAQGIASAVIFTLDHLIFANNHCWLDGPLTAALDALLVAGSLQVTSNRFQESVGAVYFSGLTYGISNVTTYNTATFCLFTFGVASASLMTPNVIFDRALCPQRKEG